MNTEEEPMEISGDRSGSELFSAVSQSLKVTPNYKSRSIFSERNSSNKRRSIATSTPTKHSSLYPSNIRRLDTGHGVKSEAFMSTKSNRRRSAPVATKDIRRRLSASSQENEATLKEQPGDEKFDRYQYHKKLKRPEPLCSTKQKVYLMFFMLGVFLVGQFVYVSRNPNLGCRLSMSLQSLKQNLQEKVFGQHIASDLVTAVSQNIFDRLRNSTQNTHYTISFHGWTGVGKNHMTSILSKMFLPSKRKVYLTPMHFPHASLDSYYEESIPVWIQGNITKCAMNIFVFDEMDKASPFVIKGLKQALMNLTTSDKDKVWTLFILLSNSRASDINNYVFSELESGRERESLTHEDLLQVLMDDIGKQSWYGEFYQEKLIDVLVPFLPLSRSHVLQCIKRDLFMKRRVPSQELVDKVIQELTFYQPFTGSETYSTTGCKRVSDKVDFHTLH